MGGCGEDGEGGRHMYEYAPRRDFVDALARTRLVPEQIALQGRDLSSARRHILVCIRLATRTDEAARTLSSFSGVASAKRFASAEISSSDRSGIACAAARLRFDSARFAADVASNDVTDMRVAVVYRADRFLRGGDHEPFLQQGFPAARFTEPHENFAHQHQVCSLFSSLYALYFADFGAG